MSRYPLSFKAVLVMLGLILGMAVFLIPSSQGSDPAEMAIPDALLPWNQEIPAVVDVLNQIYQYNGKPTEWAMCATSIESYWKMCLQGENKAGPFTFHFKDDKLSGYTAEFPASDYGRLIKSAKTIYNGGRGVVKSKSREFRIYEMSSRDGWLELYMVYDKVTDMVRLQAKYKYTGKQKNVKEFELPIIQEPMEDKAWHGESSMAYVTPTLMTGDESLNCLSVVMLKPLSSKNMRGLGAPLRRVTLLALASLLSTTN